MNKLLSKGINRLRKETNRLLGNVEYLLKVSKKAPTFPNWHTYHLILKLLNAT